MQPNGKLSSTAYADHLRGCADLATEISTRMDIRDDSARQACFATVIINAERHNIFMEPVPKDTKTPVEGSKVAVSEPTEKGVSRDEAAAAKADAQILDVPKHTTPEDSESAKRTVLLEGVHKVTKLLNQEGHVPPITPKALNAVIKHEFAPKNQLGTLDVDELERLLKFLSTKLDETRAAKKQKTEEIDF